MIVEDDMTIPGFSSTGGGFAAQVTQHAKQPKSSRVSIFGINIIIKVGLFTFLAERGEI